jgi:IS1 family transposase
MTEMLDRSCIWCYYRPMNKLDVKKRAQILACLVEGNSIRATVRMTGAAKNTVVKLLADVGAACAAYQDKTLRNLPCKRLQCDEIWSFVYAKAKNVATAKAAPEGAGDAWTWTAIDADTKLVAAWMVGPRDSGVAYDFMQDLAARLSHRVQLTTDGLKAYLEAVEGAFGSNIDFAQLVKLYGPAPANKGPERKYSPENFCGTKVMKVAGDPDGQHISTSYVSARTCALLPRSS